jgi:lipoprotein-anchoring transpeptidase ErfK/SrfK
VSRTVHPAHNENARELMHMVEVGTPVLIY